VFLTNDGATKDWLPNKAIGWAWKASERHSFCQSKQRHRLTLRVQQAFGITTVNGRASNLCSVFESCRNDVSQ
jgi:hypothetical protein